MAAAQAAPALAADALCCLGLGFLLGALYDLARFLLGDRRAACFAADVGAFCLAAVLLCSFSASRSRAGTVRWYMAAALLAGDMGYFSVLTPATRTLEGWIKWRWRWAGRCGGWPNACAGPIVRKNRKKHKLGAQNSCKKTPRYCIILNKS